MLEYLREAKKKWIIALCFSDVVKIMEDADTQGFFLQSLLAFNFEEQLNFSNEEYDRFFKQLKKTFYINDGCFPAIYNNFMHSVLLSVDKNRRNSTIELSKLDHRAYLNETMKFIKDTDVTTYNVIVEFVLCLINVESVKFRSTSLPRFLGCIFLNSSKYNDIEETALSIVHEMAHYELFLINMLDPLIVDDSKDELVFSDFQNTQRPPIGRLHSCHAIFRMIAFQKKANRTVGDLESILNLTLKTFSASSMTEAGRYLVDNIYCS